LTFNGEIFNFQALRDQLEKTGKYVFRSKTDTEVILYAILEWGIEGALKRFRGMYAFGLYDGLEGSLTPVCDPLGIKPLYYYVASGIVVFASVIKAILTVPGFTREIDMYRLFDRVDRNFYRYFLRAPTVLRTLFYKAAQGWTPPYPVPMNLFLPVMPSPSGMMKSAVSFVLKITGCCPAPSLMT
jgi:asparagine synthetase B (glutamine-hydrolysing)